MILNKGGDQTDRGYYGWPPGECVGRGLVAVVRALTPAGADVAAVYNQLFKPLQVLPKGSPSQQPLPGGSSSKKAAPKKAAPKKAATKKAATKKAAAKKPAPKKPAPKKPARASKR